MAKIPVIMRADIHPHGSELPFPFQSHGHIDCPHAQSHGPSGSPNSRLHLAQSGQALKLTLAASQHPDFPPGPFHSITETLMIHATQCLLTSPSHNLHGLFDSEQSFSCASQIRTYCTACVSPTSQGKARQRRPGKSRLARSSSLGRR